MTLLDDLEREASDHEVRARVAMPEWHLERAACLRAHAERLREEMLHAATTAGMHGPLWDEVCQRINGGPVTR